MEGLMGSKFKLIYSVLSGFFRLVRKPAKKDVIEQYKIRCENCGHVDLHDNFEPSNDSCFSFFCPACDDWTYECAAD
jgi:hypothetical protein